MSLYTAVVARVPDQTLVELTNQKTSSATTLNTSILTLACTDTAADFEVYANQVLDTTDARHVTVGVAGVLLTLREWIASDPKVLEAARERWIDRCRALASVTSRDRISITSSSELTPEDEVSGTDTVRPYFDLSDSADFIPDPNTSGTDDPRR